MKASTPLTERFTGIDEVVPKVTKHKPSVLVGSSRFQSVPVIAPEETAGHGFGRTAMLTCGQFCASMWTPEEAEKIQSLARSIVPDIKTHAIPMGLQVERGPDAVVEYLIEKVPLLLG